MMSKWNRITIGIIVLQISIVSVSLGQAEVSPEATPEISASPVTATGEEDSQPRPEPQDMGVPEPQPQTEDMGVPEPTPEPQDMGVPRQFPQVQIIPLLMIALAVAFGIWTTRRNPNSGIAGWLLLPAIGLIISPISAAVHIFKDSKALAQVAPEYVNAVHCGIAKNFILMGFGLIVAVLFFQKQRKAPQMYMLLILANVGLSVLVLTQGGESFLKPVLYSVFLACIWIPYFITSKRVKATFGHEDKNMPPKLPEL